MTLKVVAKLAGLGLTAAALAYLGREILHHGDVLLALNPSASTWGLLVASGVFYGAALLLLAEQWHRIVSLFGAEPRRRTWPSYTSTLAARYIPGNIFHIVGRAALLRGGALTDAALVRASAVELAMTPLAATLVLLPLLPLLPRPLPDLGLMLLSALLIGMIASRRLWQAAFFVTRLAAPALAFGMVFMGALAFTFAVVVSSIAPVPFAVAAATGLAGWLVGYATPGAPGGVGVREVAIIALLSGTAAPEEALIGALLFRGVTILGDVVCLLLGAAASRFGRSGDLMWADLWVRPHSSGGPAAARARKDR